VRRNARDSKEARLNPTVSPRHNKSTNSNETQKPISRSCDHSRCAQAHSQHTIALQLFVETRITVTTNHNGLVDQITSLTFFIFFSLQESSTPLIILNQSNHQI
jgi:hypothetical protein